jgi:hypothetical protein
MRLNDVIEQVGERRFNRRWKVGLEFLYGVCALLIVTMLRSGQENWSSPEQRDF